MRLLALGLVFLSCFAMSDATRGALLPLINTTTSVGWTGSFNPSPFSVGPTTSFTPVVMTSTPSSYGTIFGTSGGVQNGWLSNDANGLANTPVGTYTFTQTFIGGPLDVVNIKFDMLHDNDAQVFLNGELVYSSPDIVGYTLPPDAVQFSRSAVLGTNTLSFVVVNEAATGVNPVGLSVNFDAQNTTINPVPEPATVGLWALGMGAFGIIRRRRK
jgi:hypothetical protein